MSELVRPSVSVVIPTWNRARTIRQAIDSALRQSLPILEVLVCDDGSTDETKSAVAHIASQDQRVRWLPGERGGRPSIPRNRGLRETRGEWVAFLDSDDWWHPEKLAIQLEVACNAGLPAVCSNAMRVLPGDRSAGALLDWHRSRLTLADLLEVNRVVCSSCVLHCSLISKTGGFPEDPEFTVGEDYVLWLRVAALTDFAYCRDTLVNYRDDPESSVRARQEIAPEAQKNLVLETTRTWLLNADLNLPRRIAALTRVQLVQTRFAIAAISRKLRRRGGR